jgi:ribose transport system ATP-binding protein
VGPVVTPAALEATAVGKSFDGHRALRDLELTVASGEVRCLLGHNGSGKSTFVKILSGYHRPEPGARITVGGAPLREARNRIGFVHQDQDLLAEATVLENFALGRYLTGRGRPIAWRAERERLARALARFGLDAAPESRVGLMPPAERAVLAIARAFEFHHGLLVLDEPTAAIPKDEAAAVLRMARTAAAHGAGVLLITHHLTEALEVADRVAVLRDGVKVLDEPSAALDGDRLVASIARPARATPRPARTPGRIVLEVRDLSDEVTAGVSFTLRAGQILGVTGLSGSGFERVPHLLAGSLPARSGTVNDAPATRVTPARAWHAGRCLVPGDRLRQGVVPEASAAENLTLGDLRRHRRRGLLRTSTLTRHAGALMHAIGAVPHHPGAAMRTFSGGNQQKLVLARLLDRGPTALLLDEPVRGIDAASRAQIFDRIRRAAVDGLAVLAASAEHDDLADLCDTVLVLAAGRVVARLEGPELTSAGILAACQSRTPPS